MVSDGYLRHDSDAHNRPGGALLLKLGVPRRGGAQTDNPAV